MDAEDTPAPAMSDTTTSSTPPPLPEETPVSAPGSPSASPPSEQGEMEDTAADIVEPDGTDAFAAAQTADTATTTTTEPALAVITRRHKKKQHATAASEHRLTDEELAVSGMNLDLSDLPTFVREYKAFMSKLPEKRLDRADAVFRKFEKYSRPNEHGRLPAAPMDGSLHFRVFTTLTTCDPSLASFLTL